MIFDYLWLYLHVAILSIIILRELLRPYQRNLFVLLIAGTFLILVSGQAWWVLNRLYNDELAGMMHLYQYVSISGARTANFYVGLSVLAFMFCYVIKDRRRSVIENTPQDNAKYAFIKSKTYTYIYMFVISVAILLTESAGGFYASITNPGLNFSYGVTMYLILLSIGKLPILQKIAYNKKINLVDVILIVIVLFFTIINARMNALLIILQLIILLNYCRLEFSRRLLLLVPLFAFSILIIFGIYREFSSRGGFVTGELDSSFFMDYLDITTVIDWFYGFNVEGFVGLAGLLSHEEYTGRGIDHDFGLSNFVFITQFIPGALRTDQSLPLFHFSEFMRSIYPYKDGSVIPPGLEIAYSNYGLWGVILLGGFLGYLSQFLHIVMSKRKHRLIYALVSVQSLNLIRGTFSNAIFFALSEIFMYFLYKLIKSRLIVLHSGPRSNLKVINK
jgi:hypothetical protein